MLLTEIVTRTWRCDGLDCPTGDIVSTTNPFYSLSIINSVLPFFVTCDIDLCDVCIQTITASVLVQDISDAQDKP